MRRLAWLIAALLLTPMVGGHVGSSLWPLLPTNTTVTPADQTHVFPLDYPKGQQAVGDVMAFTVQNMGPADLTFFVDLENQTQLERPLPGDGAPHTFLHALAATGNVSMRFVSADNGQDAEVRFMWDTTALCNQGVEGYCSKKLYYEAVDTRIDGPSIVIPLTATTAGSYRTSIAPNDVHTLDASLWSPGLASELTIQPTTTSLGELVVDWSAQATGNHTLLLTSTNVNAAAFEQVYANQGAGAAFETLRITALTEGPFGQGTPGPATPFVAIILLALASLMRRK